METSHFLLHLSLPLSKLIFLPSLKQSEMMVDLFAPIDCISVVFFLSNVVSYKGDYFKRVAIVYLEVIF